MPGAGARALPPPILHSSPALPSSTPRLQVVHARPREVPCDELHGRSSPPLALPRCDRLPVAAAGPPGLRVPRHHEGVAVRGGRVAVAVAAISLDLHSGRWGGRKGGTVQSTPSQRHAPPSPPPRSIPTHTCARASAPAASAAFAASTARLEPWGPRSGAAPLPATRTLGTCSIPTPARPPPLGGPVAPCLPRPPVVAAAAGGGGLLPCCCFPACWRLGGRPLAPSDPPPPSSYCCTSPSSSSGTADGAASAAADARAAAAALVCCDLRLAEGFMGSPAPGDDASAGERCNPAAPACATAGFCDGDSNESPVRLEGAAPSEASLWRPDIRTLGLVASSSSSKSSPP